MGERESGKGHILCVFGDVHVPPLPPEFLLLHDPVLSLSLRVPLGEGDAAAGALALAPAVARVRPLVPSAQVQRANSTESAMG